MKIIDSILYRIFGGKITYSQCGEDIIIEHYFRNKGKSKIKYLDIGANHPKICNNTYLFYRSGSQGVSVEPNPALYAKLLKTRPRDINLNIGVNFNETPEMDFYIMDVHTLSTFDKVEAENLENTNQSKIAKTLKIKTNTINDIVKNSFDTCPDLICIDVEGWNREIVQSINFKICKPDIFLIETLGYSDEKKISEINDILLGNGYSILSETIINTIFLKSNI
jgi:FkbM family methyltransferase